MPARLRIKSDHCVAAQRKGVNLAIVASAISAVSVPTGTDAQADPTVEDKSIAEISVEGSTAADEETEKGKAFDMAEFLAMLRGKPINEEQIHASIAICATKQKQDLLEAELANLRSPSLNAFLANESPNKDVTESACAEIATLLHATEPNPTELRSKLEQVYQLYNEQSTQALGLDQKSEMTDAEIKCMLERFELRDKIATCKEKLATHGLKWQREMMSVHKEDRDALIEALPIFKGLMPEGSPLDNFPAMRRGVTDEEDADLSAGSQEMIGSHSAASQASEVSKSLADSEEKAIEVTA